MRGRVQRRERERERERFYLNDEPESPNEEAYLRLRITGIAKGGDCLRSMMNRNGQMRERV